MGPMLGYLTACCEMCVYMFYSIRTIQKIAKMFTFMTQVDEKYEALWALMAFCFILASHLRSDKLYWQIMTGCTAITFIVLLLYLIGAIFLSEMAWEEHMVQIKVLVEMWMIL